MQFGGQTADRHGGGVGNGGVFVIDWERSGKRVAASGVFPVWRFGIEGKSEKGEEGGVAVHEEACGGRVFVGEDAGESAKGATPIRELGAGAAGGRGGDEAEHWI